MEAITLNTPLFDSWTEALERGDRINLDLQVVRFRPAGEGAYLGKVIRWLQVLWQDIGESVGWARTTRCDLVAAKIHSLVSRQRDHLDRDTLSNAYYFVLKLEHSQEKRGIKQELLQKTSSIAEQIFILIPPNNDLSVKEKLQRIKDDNIQFIENLRSRFEVFCSLNPEPEEIAFYVSSLNTRIREVSIILDRIGSVVDEDRQRPRERKDTKIPDFEVGMSPSDYFAKVDPIIKDVISGLQQERDDKMRRLRLSA